MPVCLTVAHLDGLVMARSGFNHSANYRSVLCFGQAHLIEDDAKVAALHAIIERYYPGRDARLRHFSAQDIKATTVIGMEIEQASAKIRAARNIDEPEDMENQSWAGVIPVAPYSAQRNPARTIRCSLSGRGLRAMSQGHNSMR